MTARTKRIALRTNCGIEAYTAAINEVWLCEVLQKEKSNTWTVVTDKEGGRRSGVTWVRPECDMKFIQDILERYGLVSKTPTKMMVAMTSGT